MRNNLLFNVTMFPEIINIQAKRLTQSYKKQTSVLYQCNKINFIWENL